MYQLRSANLTRLGNTIGSGHVTQEVTVLLLDSAGNFLQSANVPEGRQTALPRNS